MSAAQQEELLFLSNIDQKDFLRFALFDTFRVKKRWKTPVLFALLMTAFAAACFTLRQSREQALLLSGVLLGIGLILPLVWYLWYLSSVKKEARKLGLSKSRIAYSLLLREARRVKGCIYLYVLPTRAFLMPKAEESDAAWDFICRHLPEAKCKDLR